MDKQTRDLVIQIAAQLIRQKANGDAYNIAHHTVTKNEHLFDNPTAMIACRVDVAFKCSELLAYATEQQRKFKMKTEK